MTSPRWRSLLFAPAVRPDVVAKTPRSAPDAVCVDLEDAVPPAAKETARAQARAASEALAAAHPEIAVLVRVNGVATPWFAGDVAEAVHPGLAAIIVPKVEHVHDVVPGARGRSRRPARPTCSCSAGLESALGVGRCEELAAVSRRRLLRRRGLHRRPRRRPHARGPRGALRPQPGRARRAGWPASRSSTRSSPRSPMPTGSAPTRPRAGRSATRASSASTRRQVALAHEAFTPSAAEVEQAKRMVEASEAARRPGRGRRRGRRPDG